MPANLYHFTDSAHLPYILHDGELRPEANRVGALPVDFLWATTFDKGSKAAKAFTDEAVRAFAKGAMRRVRFTMNADAFERWPGILVKVPTWEAHHTRQLEETARSRGDDPLTWRCRLAAFPIADVIAVHTQNCYSPKWEPLGLPAQLFQFGEDGGIGVQIGREVFISKQLELPDGRIAYAAGDPVPVDTVTGGTDETHTAALIAIEQLTKGAA